MRSMWLIVDDFDGFDYPDEPTIDLGTVYEGGHYEPLEADDVVTASEPPRGLRYRGRHRR